MGNLIGEDNASQETFFSSKSRVEVKYSNYRFHGYISFHQTLFFLRDTLC